ncbi:MAG: ribosome maturation factor RimM [Flavobacteriaceae bacterium]|nr:ribosome maturation factor RimM [Flavobacteriaceae bacterium]
MRKEACFFIGNISNLYSFKGEVLAKTDADHPEIILNAESIFVEIGQSLVPYFILESRWHKRNLLRLKLEDVADEQTARALVGKAIYLPKALFPKLATGSYYFHDIIGYQIIDSNTNESLGTITSINEQSAQPLFVVLHPEGKELLLPLVDDLIARADHVEKVFFYNTPPGLVELFLE